METAKASILSHINVIDFSRVVAAPFASMILGDLGAKIWKIERPSKLRYLDLFLKIFKKLEMNLVHFIHQ